MSEFNQTSSRTSDYQDPSYLLPKDVPLLLKPNGAPVLASQVPVNIVVPNRHHNMDTFVQRQEGMEAPQVKAHNFQIGKRDITNKTDIQVLEKVKTSAALEQDFPIRVLYVKKDQSKSQPLKKKVDPYKVHPLGKALKEMPSSIKEEAVKNPDLQLEREISMGDLSGIFKNERAVGGHFQGNKIVGKRGGSLPGEKEQLLRLQAKKLYAERLRAQQRMQEQLKQEKAPVKKGPSLKEQEQKELEEKKLKEEIAQKKRKSMPHANNRFEGQFKNLTEELFKKAQAQLKEEQGRVDTKKVEMLARKERERQYHEEILARNAEKLARQKEMGQTAGESLKEKKHRLQEEKRRRENEEEREHRRFLREQRRQEDHVSRLGLQRIDFYKLRKAEEDKIMKEMEEEAEFQQKVYENKIQHAEAQKKLKKGAVDFSDPRSMKLVKQQLEEEEGQLPKKVLDRKLNMSKEEKVALLREQQEKRRVKELERIQSEELERNIKLQRMRDLEDRLRAQREGIQRRQKESQERMLREAAEERKKNKAKMMAKKSNKRESSHQQPETGNIKDWIDANLFNEDLKHQGVRDPNESSHQSINLPTKKRQSSKRSDQGVKSSNPSLLKHQLPGNSMLSYDQERRAGVRDDRYGLHQGAQEFDEIVHTQLEKEGKAAPPKKGQVEIKGHAKESPSKKSDKSVESVDLKPVKEQKRTIINQQIEPSNIILSDQNQDTLPGILRTKEEAARQQEAEQKRKREAAVVIQKWGRGMIDRRKTSKLRFRMRAEIDQEFDEFAFKFKANDEFNLQRFLNLRKKVRFQNATHSVDDESISEQIGMDSVSYTDIQTESNIRSSINPIGTMSRMSGSKAVPAQQAQVPKVQNFFKQGSTIENDPLSIISIWAKRNAAPPPETSSPEQLVPEKEKPDRSYFEKRNKRSGKSSSQRKTERKQKQSQFQDIIEEDIPEGSNLGDGSENYSSEFLPSEQIPEEISAKKSDLIEESIIEESLAQSKPSAGTKKSISDSIQEDIIGGGASRQSEDSEIIEDIEASQASRTDDHISEASYLKQQESDRPKPSIKVERIEKEMEDDYENDGFENLSRSLQAEKALKASKAKDMHLHKDYRMGRKVIDDFEERKQNDQGLLKQFEGIVSVLAQKEVSLMGQRMAQLEMENRHKQEIADMRAEQIEMMKQLILQQGKAPSSGRTRKMTEQEKADDEVYRKQQAELIQSMDKLRMSKSTHERNSEKLVEFGGSMNQYYADPKGESLPSRVSRTSEQQKFSSIDQSLNRREMPAQDDDGIEEDIIVEKQSGDSDSIKESLPPATSSSREDKDKLKNMRKYLGSEESVRRNSREVLDSSERKRPRSIFEKDSFQKYTNGQFKDFLQNGNMMDDFLTQIEQAIHKKRSNELRLLDDQLKKGAITRRQFDKQAREVERWVSAERREIKQKRSKFKDTCDEIATFINSIEKDRKTVMTEMANGYKASPTHSEASSRFSQSSPRFHEMKKQMTGVKELLAEGDKPNTRYINKKREMIRDLMKSKQQAIEKGVAERLKDLEGDMVEELMQAVIDLDVEKEVEKRIEMARQLAQTGTINDSMVSRSGQFMPHPKKNVKFQSPELTDQPSSSGHYSQSLRVSSKKDGLMAPPSESIEESDIQESIRSSINQSSSASKMMSMGKSSKLVDSSSKHIQAEIPENLNESDSLDRDETYSNEFYSSHKTDLKSQKNLQKKANQVAESEAYTETFDDISQSRAAPPSQADIAEEPDMDGEEEGEEDKTEISLNEQSKFSESVKKSRKSSKRSRSPPKDETIEQEEDKEILESTRSVDWLITLQRPMAPKHESPLPTEKSETVDEVPEDEEVPEEDIPYEDDENPSPEEEEESTPRVGSDQETDLEQEAHEITDDIMDMLIRDLQQANIKLEVEDLNPEDFTDKWPFDEERRAEEERERKEQELEEQKKKRAQEAAAAKAAEENQESRAQKQHNEMVERFENQKKQIKDHQEKVIEYLDFIISVVDKHIIQDALSRPIEHDPLKILEKIQSFDMDDEHELTNLTYSQQQAALSAQLFDEIENRFDQVHQLDNSADSQKEEAKDQTSNSTTQKSRAAHHMAIFDSFNEALDLERPYKFKGLPNPWSKQTRVIHETLTEQQVDDIIQKARQKVLDWDITGAGTRLTPPPPPPAPFQGELEQPQIQESEEDRNKGERQERLGNLLTQEVHSREQDWLDYEIEDTQVRFDLADMILDDLADEVAQFLNFKRAEQEAE